MQYLKLVRAIERLFPEPRTEPIRARLSAVWNLHAPDRIPFVYGSLPSSDGRPAFKIWDGLYGDEESLRLQLEAILDRACLEDDYLPTLYPGCRVGTLPTAYGAKEVFGGDHTWVKPILRDAQDVYELPRPDFRTQGVAAEILARIRFFRAATGGRVPIQLPDMQGPLSLASIMWGTEPLLIAMHEQPAAVHHLLQRMTDDYITYVHLVQEAAEGDLVPFHPYPVVWMPPERGVCLSEDLLAAISPRLYSTFVRPNNEQVARAFGGVSFHSCGSIEHNLSGLAATAGLVGLNFNASETSVDAAAEALRNRACLVVHKGGIASRHLHTLTAEEHLRVCMNAFHRDGVSGVVIVETAELTRTEALDLLPLALSLATKTSEISE